MLASTSAVFAFRKEVGALEGFIVRKQRRIALKNWLPLVNEGDLSIRHWSFTYVFGKSSCVPWLSCAKISRAR